MAIANTSELQFAAVEEVTWGTTPATPTFQKLRITSESLTHNIENTVSNEIRPDADVSDLIQVGASATGDFGFELSYGSDFDMLLEHALRGAFVSSRLDAGTSRKSFTFEKLFEVGSPDEYLRFVGCRVGTLGLNFQAGQIITGTASVTGKQGSAAQSAISGATYSAANTNAVMAAPDVGSIAIGGVSGTFFLTQLSLQVGNNLRAQNALGELNAIGVGYGLRDVTFSFQAYFDGVSRSIYDDFVSGTEATLSWQASDGTNTYTFNLPRVKYSTGRVVAGGNNQDVFVEIDGRALYDSGEGTSIYIGN